MHGVVFRGRRYDTGDRLEYLKTVVRLAGERDDLGPEFRAVAARASSTRSWDAARPSLKTVDQHLADILAGIEPLAPLDLQLLDAHGCILAEDVVAEVDLPPFDNSSMDGYAVRVADVASRQRGDAGAAARRRRHRRRVAGGLHACSPGSRADHDRRAGAGRRRRRRAARVDRRRHRRGDDHPARPRPGQYIRRRGEDVRTGELVLEAGTRLGPGQIGLLAAVGRDRVLVRPRPRVVDHLDRQRAGGAGQPTARRARSTSRTPTSSPTAAREAGATAFRVGIVPTTRAR